jgi:hypothetical protein
MMNFSSCSLDEDVIANNNIGVITGHEDFATTKYENIHLKKLDVIYKNINRMMVARGYTHKTIHAKCYNCGPDEKHVYGKSILIDSSSIHDNKCLGITITNDQQAFSKLICTKPLHKHVLEYINLKSVWYPPPPSNQHKVNTIGKCKIMILHTKNVTAQIKNILKNTLTHVCHHYAHYIFVVVGYMKSTQKSYIQQIKSHRDGNEQIGNIRIELFQWYEFIYDRQKTAGYCAATLLSTSQENLLKQSHHIDVAKLPKFACTDSFLRFLGLQFEHGVVKLEHHNNSCHSRITYRYIQQKLIYASPYK